MSPVDRKAMQVTVVRLVPDQPPPPIAPAQVRTPTAAVPRSSPQRSPSPTTQDPFPGPLTAPEEPRVTRKSGFPSAAVVPKNASSYPKAPTRSTDRTTPPTSTHRPVKRSTPAQEAPLWSPPLESSPSASVGSPNDGDVAAEPTVAARPDRFVKLKDVAAVTILQSASVEARFEVAADGSAKVSLLKGTGISDVDAKILEFLATVRWTPKSVGGVPVADVVVMDLDTEG